MVSSRNVVIEIPALHEAQLDVRDHAVRFNVVDCGRQFGKTLLGIDVALEPVLGLAGRAYPVGWFAPTYKGIYEVWDSLCNTLQSVTKRVSVQERRIELVTGGTLELWSLQKFDHARGRKYKRVVIDEAAQVPELWNVWNAVIRPMLSFYRGDAFFLSTPKGHNGFWKMFKRGEDPAYPTWRSWQYPMGANPYIAPEEIEALREDLPESIFLQEIMAEFLEDAGVVFRRVVEAAVLEEREPVPGHQYAIGVDWGKYQDFTVITVGDLTTKQVVKRDRFNQLDYRIQRTRLWELYERYEPEVVLAEQNSIGDVVMEELRHEGMEELQGFITTNTTKAQLIEDLQLAFEQREFQILNDSQCIGELQAFSMSRLPSGRIRYGAPTGMHDDMVISLALLWHCMKRPSFRRAPIISPAGSVGKSVWRM